MSVTDIDSAVIEEYLDAALLHANAQNDWAEGYWIGRAVQHAHQNAVDWKWVVTQMIERGLDAAVVAIPKAGDPDPSAN